MSETPIDCTLPSTEFAGLRIHLARRADVLGTIRRAVDSGYGGNICN